ncbi:MAG: hypothetical protein K2X11_14020 [Acetobacteraceae bacterium]|nr:hypothetical protein [Acetobacteraceae bacterium]
MTRLPERPALRHASAMPGFRRGAAALLAAVLLSAAGCAGGDLKSGPAAGAPRAVAAAAARLPQAAGPWTQRAVLPVANSNTFTRYVLSGTQAWATVILGQNLPDGNEAGRIPDGPRSAPMLAWQLAWLVTQTQGRPRTTATLDFPDAPSQVCEITLPAPNVPGATEVSCITGAGGMFVRIRVTYPPGDVPSAPAEAARIFATLTGPLARAVTRAVAQGG